MECFQRKTMTFDKHMQQDRSKVQPITYVPKKSYILCANIVDICSHLPTASSVSHLPYCSLFATKFALKHCRTSDQVWSRNNIDLYRNFTEEESGRVSFQREGTVGVYSVS